MSKAVFSQGSKEPANPVPTKPMVNLVLVFCLASSGTCTEHRPMVDAFASPMACMVQGQQLAQEWLADHPGWQLTRVRCEGEQQAGDKPK